MSGGGETRSYDIGTVLDDGPWTAAQIVAVVLAALSIILDGFDGQLIGFAIPSLIREWGCRAATSPRSSRPASSAWRSAA